MAHGPPVTDGGERAIGSVLLLDVPDMDSAWGFFEKEPFYSNGVYQEIDSHRWRFGRVMDRFKQRPAVVCHTQEWRAADVGSE